VPYQDRDAYLLEADIGVSLSIDSIENRFAVRARLLDYLWAGLPSVVTSGDDYAQLLQNAGLAVVVRPGDAAETAQAILRQLARPTQPGRPRRAHQNCAGANWSRPSPTCYRART
jgi:hypothetical protein